jgi:hypothetical protein
MLMHKQADVRRGIADCLRCEAERVREEASALHDQRVARIAALCDTTISERNESLQADLTRFRYLWMGSIEDRMQMEVRVLGDLAALNAAEAIRSDVKRVDELIMEAVLEEKDEAAWFYNVICLDRESYNKWQASCYPVGYTLVFDPVGTKLDALDRLCGALDQSRGIERALRHSLKEWAAECIYDSEEGLDHPAIDGSDSETIPAPVLDGAAVEPESGPAVISAAGDSSVANVVVSPDSV